MINLEIITGITLTSPMNISSTSVENVIWSPSYPNSYEGNFDQVSYNLLYILCIMITLGFNSCILYV